MLLDINSAYLCILLLLLMVKSNALPNHGTSYVLHPFFPEEEEARFKPDTLSLAAVNQLVEHKPHKTYSLNVHHSFDKLPQIIQARLRKFFCQNYITNDSICILYLEALLVQLHLSLKAESLVTASVSFRGILIELKSGKLIGYEKESGTAYVTKLAMKYIGEVRFQLQHLLLSKNYLTHTLCFNKQTCRSV